jgi:hypothetical protein
MVEPWRHETHCYGPIGALPHPARENRSHPVSPHPASSYGESQAKSHDTVQAGTSVQRAVG